ncbi:MAG: 30S ribosomal protein S2 [Candidatus Hydrogenedentota bacterium]
MAVVTMRQLLESGIHFGHQTRRWNPKMAPYIFGERNGIYIIDLQKTLRQVNKAYTTVRDAVANGGTVLFVGTKKQAHEPIQREAQRCGMYYMTNRWLGGTLTNFQTVQISVKKLTQLEEMDQSGQLDKYSKKEAARLRRTKSKLEKNLAGIKSMNRLPAVMFVIDAKKEANAIREAGRLGIPCIAVVDTNADPESVPIPVPGNDDAIRAVGLFCKIIADAAVEGLNIGRKTGGKDKNGSAAAAALDAAPAAEADAVPATAADKGDE